MPSGSRWVPGTAYAATSDRSGTSFAKCRPRSRIGVPVARTTVPARTAPPDVSRTTPSDPTSAAVTRQSSTMRVPPARIVRASTPRTRIGCSWVWSRSRIAPLGVNGSPSCAMSSAASRSTGTSATAIAAASRSSAAIPSSESAQVMASFRTAQPGSPSTCRTQPLLRSAVRIRVCTQNHLTRVRTHLREHVALEEAELAGGVARCDGTDRARLEHDRRDARFDEHPCERESREPRTHDHHLRLAGGRRIVLRYLVGRLHPQRCHGKSFRRVRLPRSASRAWKARPLTRRSSPTTARRSR